MNDLNCEQDAVFTILLKPAVLSRENLYPDIYIVVATFYLAKFNHSSEKRFESNVGQLLSICCRPVRFSDT